MNKILLLAVLLLSALGTQAQTIVLTSQNIGEWNLVGVESALLTGDTKLTLPAGAQIDRKVGPGLVLLRTVSRPSRSAASREQPVMGVGPASVAIDRDNLVLIIGEDTLVDLPWKTSGSGGHGKAELTLGYDPASGAGLIEWQGQLHSFDGGISSGLVEVWLAAGAGHEWPLDRVEVLLVPAEELDSAVKPENAAAGGEPSPGLRALLQQLRKSQSSTSASTNSRGEAERAAGSPSGGVPNFAPRPIVGLEIFTPPSVRQKGRSADHSRGNGKQ